VKKVIRDLMLELELPLNPDPVTLLILEKAVNRSILTYSFEFTR
jgi:hypothetical protein